MGEAPMSAPSLPLSSSSRRSAVFLPMPGHLHQAAGFLQRDGLGQVSDAHSRDRMDSAVRGLRRRS